MGKNVETTFLPMKHVFAVLDVFDEKVTFWQKTVKNREKMESGFLRF